MITLTEVLDTHEEVLIDGSIETPYSFSFLQNNYTVNEFLELHKGDLEREISYGQNFLNILKHPNARSISEITDEIKNHSIKLSEKLSHLSATARYISGSRNRHQRKRKLKKYVKTHIDQIQPNEDSSKTLQKLSYDCFRQSKANEMRIDDSRYNTLTEMVIYMERELNLKNDTTFEKGIVAEDWSHKSITDEKLIATLFYQSMFSENSPVLVTKDGDFIRLLETLPTIIGSDEFMPHNNLFRSKIIENPVKLYFSNDKNMFSNYLDGFSIEFSPKFHIEEKSNLKEREIKEKVLKYWKEFSKPVVIQQ